MSGPDDPRILADIPTVQSRIRPNKTALRVPPRTLTYAELEARSNRAAHALLGLGVKPHDRVAWLAKTTDVYFEALFGALKIRACLAPINTRLAPPEIAAILEDSDAPVIFAGEGFVGTLDGLLASLARPPAAIALEGAPAGWNSWEELTADASAQPPDLSPEDEDDVLQLYTSGTTGLPKGVRLTNANYASFLELSSDVEGFDYREDDVILGVMPLFHVAGANLALNALAHGCEVVLLPEFSPEDVLRRIGELKVTRLFLAPAMIQMLLNSPGIEEADLSSMRTVAYGASPISEAVLTQAKARFGCGFIQFYGMTETVGVGTLLAPGEHEGDRLRSCGRAWPGHEIRILGPEGPSGPDAAEGEVGEIAIKGAAVMKGYWKNPAATAKTLVDGWLLTGDAGYRDKDGFVYVHDRVKDMIVTGGENVYPAEVENAILGCPGVLDVAVIGVPSDRWGEEVKALIVPDPSNPPDPADVVAWARQRIAAYKAPKSVDVIDVLPRNPSGKILRRELRAPYWRGRERLVG